MTDNEINRAVAERVMGWRRGDGDYAGWWISGEPGSLTLHRAPGALFEPATDIAHAFEAVDKLLADEPDTWFELSISPWEVYFHRPNHNDGHGMSETRRAAAICLALLDAVKGDG